MPASEPILPAQPESLNPTGGEASADPKPPSPLAAIGGWFKGVLQMRAVGSVLIAGVAASVGWFISQADAASAPIEKFIKLSAEAKVLTDKYAQSLSKDDPAKSELLTTVLFRVRMGVHSPELGENLLCWVAARAQSRPSEGGASATTAADILKFMDDNAAEFPLRKRRWAPVPGLYAGPRQSAADFCRPYLASLPATPRELTKGAGGNGAQPAAPLANIRFFLQIAAEAQRPAANALAASLAGREPLAGIQAQGVQLVAKYVGGDEIRFYKPADRGAAERLAAALSCRGKTPPVLRVKGYETNPAVRPGTVELWIGPSAPGEVCRLKP